MQIPLKSEWFISLNGGAAYLDQVDGKIMHILKFDAGLNNTMTHLVQVEIFWNLLK